MILKEKLTILETQILERLSKNENQSDFRSQKVESLQKSILKEPTSQQVKLDPDEEYYELARQKGILPKQQEAWVKAYKKTLNTSIADQTANSIQLNKSSQQLAATQGQAAERTRPHQQP